MRLGKKFRVMHTTGMLFDWYCVSQMKTENTPPKKRSPKRIAKRLIVGLSLYPGYEKNDILPLQESSQLLIKHKKFVKSPNLWHHNQAFQRITTTHRHRGTLFRTLFVRGDDSQLIL